MTNKHTAVINTVILRRHLDVGELHRHDYYLLSLPINPVVGLPSEDFNKVEKCSTV